MVVDSIFAIKCKISERIVYLIVISNIDRGRCSVDKVTKPRGLQMIDAKLNACTSFLFPYLQMKILVLAS